MNPRYDPNRQYDEPTIDPECRYCASKEGVRFHTVKTGRDGVKGIYMCSACIKKLARFVFTPDELKP